jgi:hypothetical protein
LSVGGRAHEEQRFRIDPARPSTPAISTLVRGSGQCGGWRAHSRGSVLRAEEEMRAAESTHLAPRFNSNRALVFLKLNATFKYMCTCRMRCPRATALALALAPRPVLTRHPLLPTAVHHTLPRAARAMRALTPGALGCTGPRTREVLSAHRLQAPRATSVTKVTESRTRHDRCELSPYSDAVPTDARDSALTLV